jgi:hypothetical protein
MMTVNVLRGIGFQPVPRKDTLEIYPKKDKLEAYPTLYAS